MSARVMNALGASALERTICATAGITGTLQAHGVSPEVDPEEWPNARFLLIWGWNPLSTAPHLWRKLLDARSQGARLVVVDPFRSRTARLADEHLRPLPGTDAALAIGMMRAIVDAGLHDDEWCRAHTDGYDELLDELGAHHRRGVRGAVRGRRRDDRPRGSRLRLHPARAAAARRGRPAPRRRAGRVRHGLHAAAAHRRLEGSRRRLLLHPDGHGRGDQQRPAPARGPRPGSGADDQHVAAGRGTHRPGDGPAGEGARLLELEPGLDRARPGARARGARPRRPLHGRARAVHDRHRAARRRDPPGHHPARAPRRGVLVGAPLRDLERAGDRAAGGGEGGHRDVPPPRRAAGPRRPVLPGQRRGARGAAARRLRGERPARARLDQGGPRPGADPACKRRVRHRERPRGHARALRAARRGRRRGARRALPARAGHAEDAPVPQLDLRQPAPAALGAAGARRWW